MRYSITLNNQKCLEWQLNANQGILVSLINEASSWAEEEIIDDKVYYFVSRNLILKELPMFFEKADTVYRNLKVLAEKGIIEYIKHKGKDLIRLTEKGKSWNFIENNIENNSEKNPNFDSNSEKNPSKFGKKSENNSEKNPTYKYTNIQKDINDNNKEKINKKEIAPKGAIEKNKNTKKLLNYIDSLDLDTQKKAIFKEWIDYKKTRGQYKDTKSIDKLIKKFEIYDSRTLQETVDISIMNNWSGLFPAKTKKNNLTETTETIIDTSKVKMKQDSWWTEL